MSKRRLGIFLMMFCAVAFFLGSRDQSKKRKSAPEPQSFIVTTDEKNSKPSDSTKPFKKEGVQEPARGAEAHDLKKSQDASYEPEKVWGRSRETVDFEVIDGWAVAQGDILLGKVRKLQEGKKGRFQPSRQQLWPSHKIPYAISKKLANDPKHQKQVKIIRDVVEYYNQNTAVQLVPYKGEEDALVFSISEQLCASYLGQVGGLQPIYLSPGCGFQEVVHEVMHALGFIHEQSREDRDRYIRIFWENIPSRHHQQFAKLPSQLLHEYDGAVFDFHFETSMIYSDQAFLKNELSGQGEKTMRALDGEPIINYQNGLSETDKERIYLLYGR